MPRGFFSEDARRLIGDTLRLYVGLHRRFSWADLAGAAAIKEGTLRSYAAEGGAEMPFHVLINVFSALPIEARARVLAPLGVTVREADVDDAATLRRTLAQASRLVADGTEALEDGALDHRERAALARAAADLMPAIQAMAAGTMT